jgi:hypothetical protein
MTSKSVPRNSDRRSDKENVVVASHARQPANRTQSPPHTLDRRRTEHLFGVALTASQQIKTSARIGGSARVLKSFSITQCDVTCKLAGYPAGRGQSRPALNGRAHASGACVLLFRVVRDGCDQPRHLRLSPAMGPFGFLTEPTK